MLDREQKSQITTRRTFIIGAGKLSFLVLLLGRLFFMQFIKKDQYRTLSDKNRISMIVIHPMRGEIYDKNKKILAKNKVCLKLFLDKNANPKFLSEVDLIAEILELEKEQLAEIYNRIKKGNKKVPIIIIDNLNWSKISSIEERKADLISIFIDNGYMRFYTEGLATAHLLGYMGKPNKKQQEALLIIDENFKIGKSGIEEYYDDVLRGKFGHKQVEVNAFGRNIRSLAKRDSISGDNLQLNIDLALQAEAMKILNSQGSSAVVMNCKDGGILLLSSSPSYDPNNFDNLSNNYWQSLIDNPYKPLINKTVHSMYPPGSVFKIITFLAALDAGFDPNTKFSCNGSSILGSNSFRCANRRGHGHINLKDGIKYSCNTYVFETAKIIGAEKIITMANRFGFGEKTGIDLKGEQSGFLPSKKWKKERHGTVWSLGDTLNLSIGQGFLLCTPMQLVRFMGAIASGKLFTPRISQSKPIDYKEINIAQEYLDIIKQSLYEVMNSPGGTGYYNRLMLPDVQMSGKTGTAQVQAKLNANDDLNRASLAWHRRNHAIFAGYAPSDDPLYAINVYFDHGGGGGKNAVPIARDIMHRIFS